MTPSESFYRDYINREITLCDRQASRITSKNPCLRQHAEVKRVQAAFYEDHKEELIDEMVRYNLETDVGKIHSFLAESFINTFCRKRCFQPFSSPMED